MSTGMIITDTATREQLSTLPRGLYDLQERKVQERIYDPLNDCFYVADAQAFARIYPSDPNREPRGIETWDRGDGMRVAIFWDIIPGTENVDPVAR